MPWFRFYSEALTDRKIKRIVQRTGMAKATVLGVWVTFLCLANDSPERGKLMFSEGIWLTEDEILAETGVDIVSFGKIVKEFQALNMVQLGAGYEIVNWDNRQFKSDNSSARVARYRARKRKEKKQDEEGTQQELHLEKKEKKRDIRNDVTLLKRYSHVIDTDPDTDPDTETHKRGDTHPQRRKNMDERAIWNGIVDVMKAFSEQTGIAIPDLFKRVDYCREKWVAPAREILGLCDDNPVHAAEAVRESLRYMKENDLRYSSVGSIVNIARSAMAAKEHRQSQSPDGSSFAELTPEAIDAMNEEINGAKWDG